MDISKAKRVVELSRGDKRILVTLWEGDRISSCVDEERLQRCETCEGNEEVCEGYIDHLKEQGYEATEVELGAFEAEESLPRFLEERGRDIMPAVEPSAEAEE